MEPCDVYKIDEPIEVFISIKMANQHRSYKFRFVITTALLLCFTFDFFISTLVETNGSSVVFLPFSHQKSWFCDCD